MCDIAAPQPLIPAAIVRTFIQMRNPLATPAALARKAEQLDHNVTSLYDSVRKLLDPGTSNKKPIGYIWHDDEERTRSRRRAENKQPAIPSAVKLVTNSL